MTDDRAKAEARAKELEEGRASLSPLHTAEVQVERLMLENRLLRESHQDLLIAIERAERAEALLAEARAREFRNSHHVVKLARALTHALEWMREEGCDCGTDEPGTCALCEAERVLEEVAE